MSCPGFPMRFDLTLFLGLTGSLECSWRHLAESLPAEAASGCCPQIDYSLQIVAGLSVAYPAFGCSQTSGIAHYYRS